MTRQKRRHGPLFAGVFVLLLGATALFATSAARGPERELRYEEIIESSLPAQTLGVSLRNPINWPSWFHGVIEAKVVNVLGHPYGAKDQVIVPGALVALEIQPKASQEESFPLTFHVRQYIPDQVLDLELIQDPTLKITPFLRRLRWTIKITPLPERHGDPGGNVTGLSGVAAATTAHWKTRLLGSLAEATVMRQFFYPDLDKLSRLEHPLAPDGSPVIFK